MKSKPNTPVSPKTSRRQFAKSIAATLVAAPLAARLAKAQTPTKKEAVAPPSPQPSPTPQKPSPLAEAYAEVARVRFGEKWTPEQLEQVRKDLNGNVNSAARLRSVKLKNGDEPDFIFSAL
jgi:anaerobic selenocysteine-containing dehydrogenase